MMVAIPVPFIVGVGRSGTTLLRLMLDAHPELAIPPETHFIPELLADPPADGGACLARLRAQPQWGDFAWAEGEYAARLIGLAPFDLAEAVRLFFRCYAEMRGKARWGDKTPPYAEQMAAIGALLPEAHFIHIVRDARDVALSYRDKWFRPEGGLAGAARLWRERILKARAQAASLGSGRYLELRFEDLVLDPEPVLQRVCAFLELPFDAAMLRYHEQAEIRLAELGDRRDAEGRILVPRAQRLSIHTHTRRPPDAGQIGKWRTALTPQEVRLIEGEAGELLQALGYA